MTVKEKLIVKIEDYYLTANHSVLRYYGNKYFRNSEIDENAPHILDVLKDTSVSTTKIDSTTWSVKATLDGEDRISKIKLYGEFVPGKDTVIFHPATSITMHDIAYSVLIDSRLRRTCNIFYIIPQYHEAARDIIQNCTDSFFNAQKTIVGSIISMEEAIKLNSQLGGGKTIIYGLSLGGITASWHLSQYNSADIYFPVMAIPNATQVMLSDAFIDVIDKYDERVKNESYWRAFDYPNHNFEVNKHKVYPIVNRHDKYVPFNHAQEAWKGLEYKVLDVGHLSVIVTLPQVKDWIWTKLIEQEWFNPPEREQWPILFKK